MNVPYLELPKKNKIFQSKTKCLKRRKSYRTYSEPLPYSEQSLQYYRFFLKYICLFMGLLVNFSIVNLTNNSINFKEKKIKPLPE